MTDTSNAVTLGLVLDCADPVRLSAFWTEALGYVSIGEVGNYVALFPDGRPGPKLLLQRVEEEKVAKNRMHLDIEVADIEAEAGRLEALGATRVQPESVREHDMAWIVMADPEGTEFCGCDGGAAC